MVASRAAASRAATPRAAAGRAQPYTPVPALRIDFSGARSKQAMLVVVAETLKFPAYFGMNLDALHDCLTDLELPAGTRIELFKLARTPAGDAVHKVFVAAARYWAKQGRKAAVSRA